VAADELGTGVARLLDDVAPTSRFCAVVGE
jgi:hypothetical protein